jgi:phage gpG-like protein
MMNVHAEYPTFVQKQMRLYNLVKSIPKIAGQEFVNHSITSFRIGGYIDGNLAKWKERRNKDTGRATLVKSGALRRSIRLRTGATWFEIYTDMPYAKIHNEGGTVVVSDKQRAFFWAMHNKAQKSKRKKNPEKESDLWRRLALCKTLTYPKRQFMGDSQFARYKAVQQVERQLSLILG